MRGYTIVDVITTQSSFWRPQALISGPCDQHFSDSHQNPFGFTPKSCLFCSKIYEQSNSLNSVRFCNISVRPCSISGDLAGLKTILQGAVHEGMKMGGEKQGLDRGNTTFENGWVSVVSLGYLRSLKSLSPNFR